MPAGDFAITTPEGVRFHLTLAGPPARAAAALLDYGLLGALFAGFSVISGPSVCPCSVEQGLYAAFSYPSAGIRSMSTIPCGWASSRIHLSES